MGRGRMGNLKRLTVVITVLMVCHYTGTSAAAFDIAEILDGYPEFSLLSQLLTFTEVADDINSKTGLTLFAPPNAVLSNFQAMIQDPSVLRDVLRHHVAINYFEFTELQGLPSDHQTSVPTLLQSTTIDPDVIIISNNQLGTVVNNTIQTLVVSSITQLDKEISIVRVNQVLRPDSHPSPPQTSSDFLIPFNITRTLRTLQDFTVFERYLTETGMDSVFNGRQGTGAGCTIFAPTDEAFNSLPGNWFQKFSKNEQRLFLEYHSLNEFFELGDLWKLVQLFPVDTIASRLSSDTKSFFLEVNSTNGVVKISAGKSNAKITATLYESDPVIVFAIDAVLLPRELFGDDFVFAPSSDLFPPDLSPAASGPPLGYAPRGPRSTTPLQATAPVNSGGGRRRRSAGRAVTLMACLLVSLSLYFNLQ